MMRPLLFTLLLTLPAPAQEPGPALDAASVVSHPGRWAGDYAAAVEDLLGRLEADPASPYAAGAWSEVEDLARVGEISLDPARLQGIFARTTGALAHLRAGQLLVNAARRTRFQDEPHVLQGDVWGGEAVRAWHVLGPFGPLDHPAPLHLAPGPESPETALQNEHLGGDGGLLGWRTLPRPSGQLMVLPARGARHTGAGLLYLRAHVELFAAEALLELHCTGRCQVWWNGEQVFDLSTRGPGEGSTRFLIPVAGAGFNELLVRVENRIGERIGARFVDAVTGQLVPITELDSSHPFGPRPAEPEVWSTEGAGSKRWTKNGVPTDENPWDRIPQRPTYVAPSVTVPAEEPPEGGMERAAWALERITRGRPDQALALGMPAGLEGPLRDAWLRVRFEALVSARHLPAEVARSQMLQLEEQCMAGPRVLPELLGQRVMRLLGEDRPVEALAELDLLEAARPWSPGHAILRSRALDSLDGTGVLSLVELQRQLELHPGCGQLNALLASTLAGRGDPVGALPFWVAALKTLGEDQDIQKRALVAMAVAGGEHLAQARAWLEAWQGDAPDLRRPRELLTLVLYASGADAELEELLVGDVARAADDDQAPRRSLTEHLISMGEFERAREILGAGLAADPGNHAARATLSRLGEPQAAERFFATFGPNREEAISAATGPHDSSIAEALDSGLVYFYPDGSSHQRYHTITLALDRKGTELLHTEPVAEHARLAQVVKADGSVLEPSSVGGEWVMPSLEPGDAVELVWDQFTKGRPGTAPSIGWWRFSSFEKPFVRSRYVIFVPDGLPGELRTFQFDGTHDQVRFGGGTVHVLLAEDRARQEEEPLSPSFEEILPWVQFGGDRPLSYVEGVWRERLGQLAHIPADLEGELRALVETIDPAGSDHQRAAALFDAVTTHVIDFRGSGLASQVWPNRRGNPIFLLGALYDLAGIEFEWAVLEEAVAPELDPEPLQAFEDLRGYQVPALRLAGEPAVWVLTPAGRGESFGAISADQAGARVLVLEDGGSRVEELPRDGLADSWDQDVEVVYDLEPGGGAAVTGRLRITTAQGPLLREQLQQLSAQQRTGAARNIAGQTIPGLDLEGFDFPGLAVRGAPFEFTFSGRVPGFAREGGAGYQAGLPMRPTGLATGVGAADRTWPLAMRFSQRQRVSVLIRGEGWRVVAGPQPFRAEREGFEHALAVEPDDGPDDGSGWRATRTFVIRGAVLAPAEVPAFLAQELELERETGRAIILERTE